MKLHNIVLLPISGDLAQKIRQELLAIGLEFYAIRVDQKPFLMVVSDLGQLQPLTDQYDLETIYTSDSCRETYRLDLGNVENPTKLGKLSRATKEEAQSSSFFFSIYDNGNTYYYATK